MTVKVLLFIALIFSIVACPVDALSAQSKVVPWNEMKDFGLDTIISSQFSSPTNLYRPEVPDETVESVLEDPKNQISPSFKVPAPLKESVGFWLRIYTQYSTKQVLVFDSTHLGIIYEVLDLRPFFESASNATVFEARSNKYIQEALSRYRKAFIQLSANPNPRHPSREQRIILSKIRRAKHRHSFAELAESLKVIRGQRDNVIEGLIAAETYLPKMEMIFSLMGVPKELTRLALVESSFNLRALSKVGALGVWQFMPSSGKTYLMIDDRKKIDERLSPLKSTFAAGKLLLWNYRYLGSWVLAVIAYNHGPKNLPRMANRNTPFSKLAHLFVPCKKKPELGFASRNYYSEFLAAVYAESYRRVFYGESPSPRIRPVTFQRLAKKQTGLSIAIDKGIPLNEFRMFNADIQDLHRPLPKGFWIAVPGTKDDISEILENSIGVSQAKSHHSQSRKNNS